MLLSIGTFILLFTVNLLLGLVLGFFNDFTGRTPLIILIIIIDIGFAILTGEKLWLADILMYLTCFLVTLTSPYHSPDNSKFVNFLLNILISTAICLIIAVITMLFTKNNIVHTGEYTTITSGTKVFAATKDYDTDQLIYPKDLLSTLDNFEECQIAYENRTDFILETITTYEKIIDYRYRTPKVKQETIKTTCLLHVPFA